MQNILHFIIYWSCLALFSVGLAIGAYLFTYAAFTYL